MKILFTGGGSGGHILPIVAVAREIRASMFEEFKLWEAETKKPLKEKNIDFFYLGPKDEFGRLLLTQEGIKIKQTLAGKVRRYITFKSFFQNLFDIFIKIPIGIIQSFVYIFFLAPDVIFSKGGFGSIPTVIAGWLLGTPIFLHEADVVPGMANRFLSIFSREIFISFRKTPYFKEKKMLLVGNPIRRELLESPRPEAKKFFKLTDEKPVILILGGSQGSQRINDKILEILPKFLEEFQLIHQCGEKNFKEVRAETTAMLKIEQEKNYHLFSFLKEQELKRAYAACDLIVSRAGAGSIFEIAAVGKPSILIPLPESAQRHQFKNAYTYSATGAALVLEEETFTPPFFLEKLRHLFSHPEELENMHNTAKQFSKPFAAKTIAGYIIAYLLNKQFVSE